MFSAEPMMNVDRNVASVTVNVGHESLSLDYGRVYLINERKRETFPADSPRSYPNRFQHTLHL